MFEEISLGLSIAGLIFSFIISCLSIMVGYLFWNWFKRKVGFEIIFRKRNYLPEAIAENEIALKELKAIQELNETLSKARK